MSDNQTKLIELLKKYTEKILIIDFFSDKSNLQDINRVNKDISIIYQNLTSATEIVLIFNLKVSPNSRIKIPF